MCGIWGVSFGAKSEMAPRTQKKLVRDLFVLSESRGKEASGFAFNHLGSTSVFKKAESAREMVKTEVFRETLGQFSSLNGQRRQMMGHARLVTNGFQGFNQNNQPVDRFGVVCVHNGIVVNDNEIWSEGNYGPRASSLDTEVVAAKLSEGIQKLGFENGLKSLFERLEGSASIAAMVGGFDDLLLATNTGSLYYYFSKKDEVLIFCSERWILDQVLKDFPELQKQGVHLKAGDGLRLNAEFELAEFALSPSPGLSPGHLPVPKAQKIVSLNFDLDKAVRALKRCSKCLLPETFPFIKFDPQGVCSVCHNYRSIPPLGKEALREELKARGCSGRREDVVVAFSGGRDSSYAVHYLEKEMGIPVTTYTFDWGMVTDLARRNIARINGSLGQENILVSADIKRKRENIRKNINAWIRSPELGMIPLFMAGDKEYFYQAARVGRQVQAKAVFFCANNLEKTGFKTGFCGIDSGSEFFFKFRLWNKIKLAKYYGLNFLKNPRYFNSSMQDTMKSFYYSFGMKHNFMHFFDFVPYDEKAIEQVLLNDCAWEVAKDTDSTWRIGDGTAAFYNYIYYTVAGFTEFDTFRSNQIREGLLNREEALKLVLKENQPRYDAILDYAHTIGFNCEEVLKAIDRIPKHFPECQ